jgi:hypothetical protein
MIRQVVNNITIRVFAGDTLATEEDVLVDDVSRGVGFCNRVTESHFSLSSQTYKPVVALVAVCVDRSVKQRLCRLLSADSPHL